MPTNSVQEQIAATQELIRQTVEYCAQLKINEAQTQQTIKETHILIEDSRRLLATINKQLRTQQMRLWPRLGVFV